MSSKYPAGILCLVLALAVFDICAAAAAMAQKSAPPGRESLYASCRRQVFRKYGRKGHNGKLYLLQNFVLQRTDNCVTSGGKAI
jgi:hypothetical protein